MLIVGPRCVLDAFLAAASCDLPQPVSVVAPGAELPRDRPGTLVMLDLAQLAALQQRELLAWLDVCVPRRPQILSLSERHLWDAERPALRLDLYYRLNTMCLELRVRV